MGRKTPGVCPTRGSGGILIGKPCPKQIPHPLVSGGDPVFRGLGRSIRVPRVERGRGIVLDAELDALRNELARQLRRDAEAKVDA